MTQCTTCGDADALLFTCSHCDREFCADHQFPHHACEAFAAARAASGRDDDSTPGTGWAATAGAATAAETSSEPAAEAEPAGGSARESEATAGGSAVAAEPAPTAGTGDGQDSTGDGGAAAAGGGTADDAGIEVTPIARDAARERRPDRQGPSPTPKGPGLPSERRDDRTVVDWMREQSYPGYLAKVGSLSLLFTTSYYAGLAAVL